MNENIRISKGDNTYDLHVMWSIHNKCNYSCSYCPDNLHNGDWSWLQFKQVTEFIDKMEDHYVKRLGFKNILISFTGGEPTLWKDFKKFVKYINEKGFRCGLTTNGSVSPRYWEGISTAFDYICLSFHPEKADIDKFLACYEYLHNAQDTVIPSVRVMMHKNPDLWSKGEGLIEQLKKFPNWSYECVHILENYGIDSEKIVYDSKIKTDFLEANAFKEKFSAPEYVKVPDVKFNYILHSENSEPRTLKENILINENNVNFKGWNCMIGIEELFIHFSGVVKTSGCPDGEIIGNILYQEDIRFPVKPTVCTTDGCYCPTDIRITKSAPGEKIDYTIKDDQGELVKIGSQNSYFKHRIHLNITSNSKLFFTSSEIVQQMNNLINSIAEEKNIGRQEICLYLKFSDHMHDDSDPKFIEELLKINCFTVLFINPESLQKSCLKTIASNCAFTNVTTKTVRDLSLAVKLIKEYQEKTNTNKLFINIHPELDKDVFTLHLLKQIQCLDFYEFNIINENQVNIFNKMIQANGSELFTATNSLIETKDRCHPKFKFAFNELCNMDNNRKSTLMMEGINSISYKGWPCNLGKDFHFISDNLKVMTSSCKDAKYISPLSEFKLEANSTKNQHTCQQERCNSLFEQLIPKSKN